MNILRKIKKLSFLELLLIVLIISFIMVFYRNFSNKEGFVENKGEFTRKTDSDIFDDLYVDLYDNLVYNKTKNDYEVGRIFDSNTPNIKNKILDIGCSTGHHVNLLNKSNTSVIGIDSSPAMIKKAKANYPKSNFKLADALNSMEFSADTFTHISCLYFTIYYIKDKKLFLENCYNWLIPGGVLILHLVDMHNFDPIIPIANPIITTPNKAINKRTTNSSVKFNTLDYTSNFDLDDNIDTNSAILDTPNAVFKEVIKFKDPKGSKNSKDVRINEHNLYMSSQKSIISLARDTGFIMQSQEEMTSVKYDNNFIYTLQKPT